MVKRNVSILMSFALLLLSAGFGNAETYNGVEIESATSFADSIVEFTAGEGTEAPYNDSSRALGIPDFTEAHNTEPDLQVAPFPSVSLGDAGSLTLRFTNNSLTTSGDDDIDLWVFEVGGQIEASEISISKDGVSWVSVDTIGGSTSGIDIDAYLDSGVELWSKYYFVRITDTGAGASNPPAAGTDVDAIAALSNVVTDDVNAPVAVIGPDQTVSAGATVTLDATASYDPDGGSFTYLWTQTSGTTVTLLNSTSVQATFTAPSVVSGGESLAFSLTVTDSGSLQSTANTIITVLGSSGNLPPVADAGPDQDGFLENAIVLLNGSNSYDPEAAAIQSYSWTQLSGITVTLTNASSANATFTVPFVGASGDTLVFELTVTDDNELMGRDRCSVTITDKNAAPVANAGANQLVSPGDTVTLDGSGSSDSDTSKGDQISYHWKQLSGTVVVLSDYSADQPTFTSPSVTDDEALSFELTVTDLAGVSSVDTIIVNVATGSNSPPVADAGPATATMVEGASLALDGSNSSDPDGDTITYRWDQKSGPPLTFTDPLIAQPSVSAPDITADDIAVVELIVTAGGLQGTDEISITIEDTGATVSASTDGSDSGGCFVSQMKN